MLSRKIIGRASASYLQASSTFSLTPSSTSLQPVPCNHTSLRWATGSTKFNLKHPRTPHRLRGKMLHALKPLYAPDLRLPAERCSFARVKPNAQAQANRPAIPVEIVMAREVRRILDANKMVVLCHLNPTAMEELKTYRNAVWKLNMRLWPMFNNRVLRFAMEGGPYATIIPFLEASTLLVTCSDFNFGNLHRGLRRIASAVPLFVVVDAKYVLSIPQLDAFSKKYKTGIVEAHGELVSVLSNPASDLVQALQHEAMTLSACLDFAAKVKAPSEKSESVSDAAASVSDIPASVSPEVLTSSV